jgi:hypothetical protein
MNAIQPPSARAFGAGIGVSASGQCLRNSPSFSVNAHVDGESIPQRELLVVWSSLGGSTGPVVWRLFPPFARGPASNDPLVPPFPVSRGAYARFRPG